MGGGTNTFFFTSGPGGSAQNIDPSEIFKMFSFMGMSGGGGGTGGGFNSDSDASDDFIFRAFG
jgi:hypothetical protein